MLILFSIAIVVMSVVIHEVSHGFSAYLQGDHTAQYEGRLTLNPIAHIDPIGSVIVPIITSIAGIPFGWAKPVHFNPYNLKNQRWGELLVAIAGPLSNLIIALFFSLILRFGAGMISTTFAALSLIVIITNVSLAIFNLLPVPPLDGSKVLFGLFPQIFGKIRWQLERYSLFIVLVIILVPAFNTLLTTAIFRVILVMTGLSNVQLVSLLSVLK